MTKNNKDISTKGIFGLYSNCTPAKTSSNKSIPLSKIKPGMRVLFTKDHSDYVLEQAFYNQELQKNIPKPGEIRIIDRIVPSTINGLNDEVYFKGSTGTTSYFIDITGLCGDLETTIILDN